MQECRRYKSSTGVSPANDRIPSAWLESGKGGTTKDISGLSFRAWSPTLSLVGSLLKTYLVSCGLPSTTFARTWSASATPSGFGLMKLRLSARSTAGCGSSLWATPNTMDSLPQRSPESLARVRNGTRKGRSMPANLREQADEGTVRLWRTPTAEEPGIDPALLEPIPGGTLGGNNRHYNRETGRVAQFGLSQQVRLSEGQTLWRTPKADDPNHGSASEAGIMRRLEKGQSIRLQDQVNHPALFRTPDAGCSRGAQSEERFAESVKEDRLLTLNDQIAHLWPTPKASDAVMGMTARTSGRPLEKSTHLQARVYCAEMFPTPRASDGGKGTRTPEGAMKEVCRGHGADLPSSVQIFPTPTCNDAKNNNPPSQRTENGRHSDQLNVVAGGSLNPPWVEWLMGFPIGWTDIGI